jgi:hypothetical protein
MVDTEQSELNKERIKNEIIQKYIMKHYLRVVMRNERLNQSYLSNVMRSNGGH